MSYSVAPSKKSAYSKLNATDEEAVNSLHMSPETKRGKQVIETQLSTIKTKIKNLEDMHNKLGTEVDNAQFRQQV